MPNSESSFLSVLFGSDADDSLSTESSAFLESRLSSPSLIEAPSPPDHSAWDQFRDFVSVNWAIVKDFGAKQSDALFRTVEDAKTTAKENPGTTAFILSSVGALVLLMFCALLLKYRRRSGETRPLLGEQTSGEGDDAIGQVESQTKIAEMRKKMKRKSMSRFSVDFDRFNADIHQCTSGTENGNEKATENHSDEIQSHNAPNRNRTMSAGGVSQTVPGSLVASLSNLIKESANDRPSRLGRVLTKAHSTPCSPTKLRQPEDWIEEDLENVLFVSRTNSIESSGTCLADIFTVAAAASATAAALATTTAAMTTSEQDREEQEEDEESEVVTTADEQEASRTANSSSPTHDNSYVHSYNSKWRSASGSGSFSDESAGYCSETGCSTPELTV